MLMFLKIAGFFCKFCVLVYSKLKHKNTFTCKLIFDYTYMHITN